MTHDDHHHDDRSLPAPEPRDVAIDRIASGALDGTTWAAWSRHAGDDVAAWRSVAESLRDQLLLVDAAASAAETADQVELPSPRDAAARVARIEVAAATAGEPSPTDVHVADLFAPLDDDAAPGRRGRSRRADRGRPSGHDGAHPHRSFARARSAAGWMTSAFLLLALVVLSPGLGLDRPIPISTGDGLGQPGPAAAPDAVTASLSASDALDLYLERGRDEGRVVEERPDRVLVGSRPAADGTGYEVLYIRQILERAVVPELFVPTGADEEGRPVMRRLPAQARSVPRPPM